MAVFVLLSLFLGILVSQPEIPLSMNGILTKLNGESAFVLMGLLGATIMPHNLYLHSSIVQVSFCHLILLLSLCTVASISNLVILGFVWLPILVNLICLACS